MKLKVTGVFNSILGHGVLLLGHGVLLLPQFIPELPILKLSSPTFIA